MAGHRYTLGQIKDGTGFAPGVMFEEVRDYQGWANYPTWAVALWINNDQGWQESVHESVRAYVAGYTDDGTPNEAGQIVGEIIKEQVEQANAFAFGAHDGIMPASLAADLIGYATDLVDWSELGGAFLRDVSEIDGADQ